jgi:uncharacterized repeat protein (TIGR03803 family)
MIQGTNGDFYGTTSQGGANGFGTVFRMSVAGGSFTNLHSFNASDGAFPYAELARGSDGNFYGTTGGGGTRDKGTVFRISPSGIFTSLYSFADSDGAYPYGGLVQGIDGYFYGTTTQGGALRNGTVFRMSPSGSLTNLHSFGGSDGRYPYAGLVRGTDGNFYGTTASGGTSGTNGTVYRISPSGDFTNLYSFSGMDGSRPYAGLTQGSDGKFYGTTALGGTTGLGVIFRMGSNGSITNLHSFVGPEGGLPYSGLLQGSDGNYYGTTSYWGANTNYGSIFRIDPNGNLTTLHSFSGLDGAVPEARLLQGADGNFYGTTYQGGTNDQGTIFRFSVPLTPSANQISGILASNTDIIITIASVAGETYQLQFSASFMSTNWTNVAGAAITNSLGGALSFTNFGAAVQTQQFYRFEITP